MISDYLYLFLIIFVILSIIYLIYYSYENRKNDEIEFFTITYPNLIDIANNLENNSISNSAMEEANIINNKFEISYNDLLREINNRDITRDNIKNLNLNVKTNLDLQNSNQIKNMQQKLIPQVKQFPIDKLIKTIKSKYNSQYISTFSNDMKKYGIIVNDKCLTVNGLCKEDFCLLDCQNNLYTSDSQKFTTERINSDVDAAAIMNIPINKISSKNVYPFNIFKSSVNDKCLNITNDGITVENCNINNIKQQWEISPDENICVLK